MPFPIQFLFTNSTAQHTYITSVHIKISFKKKKKKQKAQYLYNTKCIESANVVTPLFGFNADYRIAGLNKRKTLPIDKSTKKLKFKTTIHSLWLNSLQSGSLGDCKKWQILHHFNRVLCWYPEKISLGTMLSEEAHGSKPGYSVARRGPMHCWESKQSAFLCH